jgi:hypothetical protein
MHGARYLVVLAGVAVIAAGCGTRTAQASEVAAAAANTAHLSARLSLTTTLRTQGMSISFSETGEYDFARSRGVLHMHGPAGVAAEVLFIPPEVYVKLPGGSHGPLPRGKSWIEVKAAGTGPLGDFVPGPSGNTNPADLLSSLRAVSSSVTTMGSATIRGVPVTHYRVRVDPAKAVSRVPRSERPGLLALARNMGAAAAPVDVWVDQRSLVRRLRVSLARPLGLGKHFGSHITLTLDFYDFGVPVHVTAPPAGDVASFSQLARAGPPGSVFRGGGYPRPPAVSGTLAPAQAASAEQAVRAFLSAVGRDNAAAAARSVLPAQRACVRSMMGGPRITVTALKIMSARPAGPAMAVVRFTAKVQAKLGGHVIPLFPPGAGRSQWLVTTESGGHWFVNLSRSTSLGFGAACP